MRVPFLSLQEAYVELKTELDAAVAHVLASGHYIGGPEVEAFESEFGRYVGARHCIGVGNGLDAITFALLAHGVSAGDEVLVPSNTFIATWLGASHAGATPVPVEPEWSTHLVDTTAFERAITRRTKAIVPVHLYGLAADMPSLHALCERRGLVLIDDAAQAHGAAVGSIRVGGFGNTTTWSFYPGKNLGALGDAGAVTTNDDAVAAKVRQLRNYGSTMKYVHDVRGYNSRLDPVQAAVLRVKLRALDAWNARRLSIAHRYGRAFARLSELQVQQVPEGRKHAYHLFVVRTSQRDALRAFLEAAGVGTLVHYPCPPHRQVAYAAGGYDNEALGATAKAATEVLSLPMGPQLDSDQVEYVIDRVHAFFGA